MKKIVMFGASGHAKVIWDAILLNEDCQLVGVVDPNLTLGSKWMEKIPVISLEDSLAFECGVIGIGDNNIRKKVVQDILKNNKEFSFHSIIHPKAIISSSVKISSGAVVLAGAVINSYAIIGEHAVLNTASVVEHDCILEDYVFVGPNATLGGNVCVGESSFIGMGASVKQKVKIGNNSILGMGSVLLQDLSSNLIAFGCPAKVQKSRGINQNFF